MTNTLPIQPLRTKLLTREQTPIIDKLKQKRLSYIPF